MVALKLVVVLVALAANSALAKPWGIDLPNPVASLSDAVKGAANAAEGIKAAAEGAAEGAAQGALSNLPGMNAIPSIPTELPKIPGMDAIPSIPTELPKVPGMDSLPKVPGMDSLPKIPGMDSLPKIPGMDALSKIPGMDKIPTDWMNKIPSFSMPSMGDLTSKLSSMMSPWNLMMKAFCMKYSKVCEVFTSAKGKVKEVMDDASGLFQTAMGKLSMKEAGDAMRSLATPGRANKFTEVLYNVVIPLKKAVDKKDIGHMKAAKIIVQAIRDGIFSEDFQDDSGALTFALEKSVAAEIITQEEADKVKKHANNAGADEDKPNKDANVEVTVNVNKDSENKEEATSENKEEATSENKEEATANVEVNVNVNSEQ